MGDPLANIGLGLIPSDVKDQGKIDVFIVRIWTELREEPHGPVVWRGTVQHVPSKTTRSFGAMQELVEFVTREAGLSAD